MSNYFTNVIFIIFIISMILSTFHVFIFGLTLNVFLITFSLYILFFVGIYIVDKRNKLK